MISYGFYVNLFLVLSKSFDLKNFVENIDIFSENNQNKWKYHFDVNLILHAIIKRYNLLSEFYSSIIFY